MRYIKPVIVAILVLSVVKTVAASSYFDLTNCVETVDNIPWKYVAYNGNAVIVNTTMNVVGSRRYNSAVPNETSGDISVPSVLGGQKVVNIGSGAFFNCSRLTRVSLPMDVEEIGYWAFMGCEALREINIPEKVHEIKGASFYKCFKLRRINIPSYVKYVSHHAFSKCYALREMALPASLQWIGYSAFQDSGLVEMSVPISVTNIGDCVFADCKALRKIDLPPTIRTFGKRMFMQCEKLEMVELPYGIDSIGELTFQGCSRLRLVLIPDGVKSIDDEAFAGCASLKSINLPDSVTNIGDLAFCRCSSLDSICIPAGVVAIGDAAFKDCRNLKWVKFMGNAPHVPSEVPFETNVVVEVLEGTKGWNDDQWRSFKIKVVPAKDSNEVSHCGMETISFSDAYFTSLAFIDQRIQCRGVLKKIKDCGPFILRPVEGELRDDEHIVHATNYQNIYIHRCNGDVKTCRCKEDDRCWQRLDGKRVVVEGVLSEPVPGCSMVSNEFVSPDLFESKITIDGGSSGTNNVVPAEKERLPHFEYESPCREFKLTVYLADGSRYMIHYYSAVLWMAHIGSDRLASITRPFPLHPLLPDKKKIEKVWTMLNALEKHVFPSANNSCRTSIKCRPKRYSQIKCVEIRDPQDTLVKSVIDLFHFVYDQQNNKE